MNYLIFLSTLKRKRMKTYSNNPKLVVCDIDGTLTRDGTVMPSEYTIDIMKRLSDKGVLLGLASGRDVIQLHQIVKEWNLPFSFSMLIGLNGSEYYDLRNDYQKLLYTLEPEDIRQIITKMLDKFPDLNCSIYRDGQRLLRYEDAMAISSKKRNNMDNIVVDDISMMWSKPCPKVMFRVSEEVMAQIEPLAIEISNDRFRCCKTQTTMMEFVHAMANKGSALKIYCDDNNIDLSDVIGIGDMDNDNELLLTAGLGVCMINGSDNTKKCADVITEKDNNHDGCAYFLEKEVLDKLA